MDMWKDSLRCALLVTLFGLSLVQSCDEKKISQCISEFTQAAGGDASVLITEQQLNDVCSAPYPTLKMCLKRASSSCPMTVRMMFEGLTDTLEHVCGEGRRDQIEYGPCLASSHLRTEVAECQHSLNRRFSEDYNADKETKCEHLSDFVHCVHSAADDECGDEAADYQDEINRMAVGPMINSVGCDIEEINGASHVQPLVGLVGVLTAFIQAFYRIF